MTELLCTCTDGICLWLCGMILPRGLERRPDFYKRVTATLLGMVAIILLFFRFWADKSEGHIVVGQFVGFFFLLLIIMICRKVSWTVGWYYTMWTYMCWHMLMELPAFIELFLLRTYEASVQYKWILALLIYIPGMIFFHFTFAKWMPEEQQKKIGPRQFISAVVIFVAFEGVGYVPQGRYAMMQVTDVLIIYLVQLLMIVILYLQSELFKKSAMRQELAVMNMLWKKEQEQYELSKENIALINQKCHDLKHQIRAIRNMSKEEIDAYLDEMEESVLIYEAIVKTGNEVLDTILTEKSLYCKERGILISCVADGSQMGFINTIDLYAILGNALDNAIEAVEKFQHKEKRQIDVLIYRQMNFLVIQIINPMKEKLYLGEELPETTKEDCHHHGFGLKSIQYMVKKYDGNLNISDEDGCFSLKILIPVPEVK